MRTLYNLIMADLKRFGNKPSTRSLLLGIPRLFTSHSFKLTFWFRVGTALMEHNNLLTNLLLPIVRMIHTHNQYQLPLGTHVGGGIIFPHFSGIVIHGDAIIGKNITIHQCVTIGTERHKDKGRFVIGDNCVLSAGAKIIGPVIIGNNVIVGANSVVTKNIPDNAVVAGVPAKILNYNGSDYSLLH